MFIPCKIKAIDASDKSTMVTFDVGGRSIAFTYSNHHAESQLVVTKLHKFGSRNSHHALKSWSELVGVEGEVNLIEVNTAFGNMPAITDFR